MYSDFINYHLLVTANPLSDCKTAISLFKILSRLDAYAREINVFLPGFHVFDKCDETKGNIDIDAQIKLLNQFNLTEGRIDYHGTNPIFHTYIKSHGNIYFNDVDFADFMLDLEEHCPNFDYCARTDLVVLPTQNGEIIYDNVVSFNLDVLGDFERGNEFRIESFFLSIFKLIRKDEDKNTLSLISKIRDLYFSYASNSFFDDGSNVLIHFDNRLLEYMRWKAHDEIFFISYSSIDVTDANRLKDFLVRNRKNVWMAPEGIPSGLDYACVIPAALRISSHCLALLSHNSAKSKWVRREIAKAISNDKKIDGILLDGFTIEDVKKYDYLDFLFENVQIRFGLTELFDNPNILTTL